MRTSFLVLAMMVAGTAALGQATPPSAGDPPPPAVARPGGRAPNVSRDACRAETDPKSLTGPERRDAMKSCMRAKLDTCRKSAIDAHIPARTGERRDYVKKCVEQGA